ncbi:MAG: OmpA family protein [Maribacter sp.]|nr:OmpA family protein [Maribacter sp.]
MSTIRSLKLLPLLCLLLVFANVEGQKIGKKIKKKVNKTINKVEKSVEDVVVGTDEKRDEGDETSTGIEETTTINTSFIDRNNTIFYDNFRNERATEYPSKWIHVKGEIQNNHFEEAGNRDDVIEWISNYATLKPTIKGDSYLGHSFKIEIQVHFNLEGGNQFYNLNFKNSNMTYGNYDLRIANSLIGPGSDNLARMPGQPPRGWHTIQVSFNKGNLKASFDGHQLVNNPDIGKYEFTHLEIYASSPGSSRVGNTRSMINHFAIGKVGLPLYDRLMSTGRIVIHDIHFGVNKYEIKKSSYPTLDKILAMLQENGNIEVSIEGHTDANGTNEDNLTLSENRAEAVKSYFIERGIKRYRLSSKGYGEEKPVSMGETEEAWAQNRRVEFVLHN